jgi:hypothetical protein
LLVDYQCIQITSIEPRTGTTPTEISRSHCSNLCSSCDFSNFWVASPSQQSKLANALHPYPLIKTLLFRFVPLAPFPKPPNAAYIMKINALDGSLMQSVVDSSHPIIRSATDAYEKNGNLYISSVKGSFVVVIPVPKV